MNWLLLFVALLAGFVFPFQAGINAQLRGWIGHPLLAALISFSVGTLSLMICPLLVGIHFPAWSAARQAPWWAWTGGLLGAFSVLVTIVLAPRLGATVFIATVVTGQMIASMILDHFGIVGFRLHPVTFWRVLGVVLLVSGVWLIRRN